MPAPTSTPSTPPSKASASASLTNWRPMWRRVAPSARRRPDLRASLEDGHEHDVGDADAAHDERHGAEAQEQLGECRGRRGACLERVRRTRDLDLAGYPRGWRCGPGRSARPRGMASRCARRSSSRRTLVAEELLRDGDADECRGVQLAREGHGREDADDAEPLIAEPDPHPGRPDAEPSCGGITEDDRRQRRRRGILPAACRDVGTKRVRQVEVGSSDADAARAALVDAVGATDRGVDARDAGCRFDRSDTVDHRACLGRQLGRASEERLAGGHAQQVRAQAVELGQEVGAARVADDEHADHGRDADGDAGHVRAARRRSRRAARCAPMPRTSAGVQSAGARSGGTTAADS